MTTASILVAEDDRTMRKGLLFGLHELGYRVTETETPDSAIELMNTCSFDLVISDLKMPETSDGLRIVREAKRCRPEPMVMVLTGFGSIELAVEAMQAGADDFVTKDASSEEMRLKINKLLKLRQANLENARILEENRRLREEISGRYGLDGLVGRSGIFAETLKLVQKVSEDGECTVLLQGESGTGKEIVARAIHHNGPRKNNPFVPISVAAVPSTLLESEMFGHVRGAFTDAVRNRDGKLKTAAGGTLFLDEVGDIPLNLQVKLLRVLQERTYEALGSDKQMHADVRVIAATNQDLEQKIKKKEFREDFYYRLNVVPIKLPPLRERTGDIPILVEHFLQQIGARRNKRIQIGQEALACLMRYDWPGNVRELENVLEQLFVLAESETIRIDDLPAAISEQAKSRRQPDIEAMDYVTARARVVRDFEETFIRSALARNHWNITHTAKAIKMSREGLHRLMKKNGMKKPT